MGLAGAVILALAGLSGCAGSFYTGSPSGDSKRDQEIRDRLTYQRQQDFEYQIRDNIRQGRPLDEGIGIPIFGYSFEF